MRKISRTDTIDTEYFLPGDINISQHGLSQDLARSAAYISPPYYRIFLLQVTDAHCDRSTEGSGIQIFIAMFIRHCRKRKLTVLNING